MFGNRLTAYIARTLLVGTAMAGAMPALAQESPPASAATNPDSDSVAIQDIVVTARKRAERTIDVPTSITAIGSAEIGRYATNNLEALSSQIPQLQITHNPTGTGAVITIRGIGTSNTGDDGVEQAVSLNFDGVPTSRGRAIQQGLFDLNNIQVLKGPQALYFGKNSPGGVVILESNGPTDRLEGYVRGGYEFRAREYKFEGAVGGPLTDTLGFRLAGQASDMTGGYVTNVAAPISAANNPVAYDHANGVSLPGAPWKWGPESKQYAGRATLVWTPGSDFKATYKLFGSHYKDNGEASIVQQLSCPAGYPNGAIRDLTATPAPTVIVDPAGNCNPKDRQVTMGALPAQYAAMFPGSNGGVPFSKTDAVISSLNLSYKVGDISLTSITGYYWYKNSNYTGLDYSSFDVINAAVNSSNKSWTQELRAVSNFSGILNFSVGGFYEHFDRVYDSVASLVRAVDPVAGALNNNHTINTTTGSTYSVVGELTLKPVPTIEIAGGARYTHESKSAVLDQVYLQPGVPVLAGLYLPAGQSINASIAANNVSPQITISWRPTPQTNFFFGYRSGFKSGGISSPNFIGKTATAANVVFGNETAKGIEGGLKFESVDRRFQGDLTMYNYSYNGLQVSAFDPVTNILSIRNAGSAQVSGVEASANYAFNHDFAIHGAVTYNKARYTSFVGAQCFGGQTAAQGCVAGAQNLTGAPLTRAPDWAGSAGFVWNHEITGTYRIGLTVDGRYSGSYYFSTVNSPFAKQGGYVLLDASLRLRRGDNMELALIGKNLTDKFYATFGSDRPLGVAPGSVTGVAGVPRTVELQATFNF